jgi:hypothetical protein
LIRADATRQKKDHDPTKRDSPAPDQKVSESIHCGFLHVPKAERFLDTIRKSIAIPGIKNADPANAIVKPKISISLSLTNDLKIRASNKNSKRLEQLSLDHRVICIYHIGIGGG